MGALRDLAEWLAARLWYQKRGLAFALCLPWLGPWTVIAWALSRRRRRVHAPRASIPVLAVGNLAVGGTGKTQVVRALAERAAARGRKVAIVARGHGGAQRGPAIVSAEADAAALGDEPVLLRRKLSATIIVARDRAAGVALALAQGCDLALLDDGLQQRRVEPSQRIWVLGAESPLGNGALLPLGPLRDPIGVLRTEDVVWLHGEGSAAGLPRVDVRSRTVPVTSSAVAGQRVFAFAGIARPERFFRTLAETGAVIVGSARFADHRRFSARDLERLCARALALGAEALVCTEKDAVRLPSTKLSLPIAPLETRLEILEGQERVEQLLDF